MISPVFRRSLFVFSVLLGIAASQAAYAACTNPAGITGEIIFNSTVNMLQFCNGTNWINAAGTSTGGGGPEIDPEVGALTPSKWCQASAGGTEIVCTADPPAGSDNLGNHLATQDVDAGGFKLKEAGSLVLKTVMGGPGVSGTATLPGLADVQDTLNPVDGEVLTYVSASGEWQASAPGSGADNLGNHTATQNIQLGTNWLSGDGGNEGLRVDASGNVGIGTAAPAASLHVTGATILNGALTVAGDVNLPSTNGLLWDVATEYIKRPGTDALTFGTESEERMRITSTGNVGIGTTGPSGRLHVNGTVYFQGLAVSSTGYYLCQDSGTNQITRGGSCSLSDIRLKTSIEDLPDALENIISLRGVSFDWKDEVRAKADGRQIGLIAQDVEKVYPQAVITNEDGTKALNYDALLGPVIESIKKLKANNDALAAKVDAQAKEIEALKAAGR